jgi:hypothetical protein
MIRLLLGRDADEDDAWGRLRDMKPPAFVFGSTLNVINDLRNVVAGAASLEPRLQPFSSRLDAAATLLDKAQRERTSPA